MQGEGQVQVGRGLWSKPCEKSVKEASPGGGVLKKVIRWKPSG